MLDIKVWERGSNLFVYLFLVFVGDCIWFVDIIVCVIFSWYCEFSSFGYYDDKGFYFIRVC